jgi:hypothetical protein
VLVEAVDRRRREREEDAEQADEDLRRDHVADGRQAGEMAAADRGEQVPPVQEARAQEERVLDDVDAGVVERRVVHEGDVPQPHRADVEDDGEDGMGDRAEGAFGVEDRPRDRSQQDLREAGDQEDRREVQQQHVLDHVHGEDLVGERVDGRQERDRDAQHAAEPREEARVRRAARGA